MTIASPLQKATITELLDELQLRAHCMVVAAYFSEEGDGKKGRSWFMRTHGFNYEQAGLIRMLSLKADQNMHDMLSAEFDE